MKINLRILILCSSAILVSGSFPFKGRDENSNTIKFHPGHYVAVGPFFDLSEIRYLDEPALQGVIKRYYWKTLEPEKGVYDFSTIEEDLKYLSAHHKQLIVFLCDRSFWIKGAMPAYLSDYEIEYEGEGFCPVRWHPVVLERWGALGKALGEKFDSHPGFEGAAIQESSLDMSEEDYRRFGYTPDGYRDALISILTGLQQNLSNCHVFWYQNFMNEDDGSHLREVADAVKGSGIIMGGPDILPFNRWYKKWSYPLYKEFKERITLFCSAQDDSYKHDENDIRIAVKEPVHSNGYLTMEEIFLYARDSLYIRYMFWNYYYEGSAPGERSYEDAIKVIRKYPAFNNSTGPQGNTANLFQTKRHEIPF